MRNPLGPMAGMDQSLLIKRAVAATAVTGAVQLATGWPLRTAEAPQGIVSLELAGSLAEAERILGSWESEGVLGWAAANVLLDASFIAAYATLLVALAIRAGLRAQEAGRSGSLRIGFGVGWSQWLAGGFDAVENLALLLLIGGARSQLLSRTAQVCAVAKFTLIGVGIAWIVGASVIARLPRRKAAP